MKAIVNGLVYNVEELLLDNGESYYAGGIEIIPDGRNIDWEQRRFELVKEMIPIIPPVAYTGEKETLAKMAVRWADAVLAEYRKGIK